MGSRSGPADRNRRAGLPPLALMLVSMTTPSAAPLRTSPLHARHLALNAKMADFGGWQMPIEYSGVVGEHTAVRTGVGVFDVSHLRKATVAGDGACGFFN